MIAEFPRPKRFGPEKCPGFARLLASARISQCYFFLLLITTNVEIRSQGQSACLQNMLKCERGVMDSDLMITCE